MPKYASMSHNMPEHDWILLDVLEYVWKCLNKLFWLYHGSQMPHHLTFWQDFEYALGNKYNRVLNMLRHSYNNNIIVTNVVILEFLSALFVHPDTPQLTILIFFTRVWTHD